MSTVIVIIWAIVIAVIFHGVAMARSNALTFLVGAPLGVAIAMMAALYTQSIGLYWDITTSHIFTVLCIVFAYTILFVLHRHGLQPADIAITMERRRQRRAVRKTVHSEVNQFKFEVE